MRSLEDQIGRSVDWLCNYGSSPVKYLTYRDLLGISPDSRQLKDLWHYVETCEPTKEIFSKQRGDGSWYSGGSWAGKPSYLPKEGYTPYSPKYVTTIWVLIILGEMGFDISDPRIRKACEFTMGFQYTDGTFGQFAKSYYRQKRVSPEPPNIPCHFAGYLTGLAKVGMGSDPRLDKSFDLLLRWQREDGGWLNERHLTGEASPYRVWTRSCPFVTYFACQALRHSGRAEAKAPLHRGLEFLARHLASKRPEEQTRFFFHGHEIMKEMLMFSEEGTSLPEALSTTFLGWLIDMYDPNTGRYYYAGKPISKMSRRVEGHTPREFKYRLYHMIEDDWLTYYITRILHNFKKRGTLPAL